MWGMEKKAKDKRQKTKVFPHPILHPKGKEQKLNLPPLGGIKGGIVIGQKAKGLLLIIYY